MNCAQWVGAFFLTVSIACAPASARSLKLPDSDSTAGIGLFCDTKEQVLRYLELMDGHFSDRPRSDAAVEVINKETGSPMRGCAIGTTVFKFVKQVDRLERGGLVFAIVEVVVIAVPIAGVLVPVPSARQFVVFGKKNDETPI